MNIRYARRVVFSTNDSAVPVTITWPDPLTDAELSEVKEFVALWLKGVERRSSSQETGCEHGVKPPFTCARCVAAETRPVPPNRFELGDRPAICKHCGEHWSEHLHTDEASTCPTANR